MYAANSSILHSKKKIGRILGIWHQHLVNVSGLRYSKQFEFQEKLINFLTTWLLLSIFTLNVKHFLWKYHILPNLFLTALVCCTVNSVNTVYSPEQNGAFCNCFSSCKPAKTFISQLKCSAFTRITSRRRKNWVFVLSGRILRNILYYKESVLVWLICFCE